MSEYFVRDNGKYLRCFWCKEPMVKPEYDPWRGDPCCQACWERRQKVMQRPSKEDK